MPLQQLSDEQIQSWSRLEKDRWWFQNLYRGDLPQLTFRSALTGFILGGILGLVSGYFKGRIGGVLGACNGILVAGLRLPSIVVTLTPSSVLARRWQERMGVPFTCTVHAPQLDVSQPMFVPVNFACSRM